MTWLNNRQSRLTFTGGAHLTPIWSPDGKQIAFTSNQQAAISVKTLGSSAPEQTLISNRPSRSSRRSRTGRGMAAT